MDFGGDIGTLQRRIAAVPEGTERRLLAFKALDLGLGQSVLEIGCGNGRLTQEIALAVGDNGRVVGLDPDEGQIAAARKTCAGIENAEILQGDATNLSLEDATFDRVVAINTMEYIPDTRLVLGEIHRVLKPGGRFVNISVLWDHWQFHGADPELTASLMTAFRAHCVHQMLPLELPGHLTRAGFGGVTKDLFTFLNTSLHPNAFAYWSARVLCAFARSQGVAEADTSRWMQEIETADQKGRFGFFNVSVINAAVRLP
ncbi:MAG: methyltransferase domain-containing protein [Pseudomonadota bacterium]